MATLPEGVGLEVTAPYVSRATNTWMIDWAQNRIVGMDDGIDAICQAIDIILETQRYQWQIYTSDFGSEFTDLIGDEYDYVVSELPRRIMDAFSVDDRILSVDNFVFGSNGNNALTCSFDVQTVFGTLQKEVKV